jgi:hypothetical protein
MVSVALQYHPGFVESMRAWLAYVWLLRRRVLGWAAVFLALDLYIMRSGYSDWRIDASVALCVVVPLIGLLMPLAFRLLWAHKVKQLGVHELVVADDGVFIQATDIRVGAAWEGYDGFAEHKAYFFLTRPTGLFSFIPKATLPQQKIDSVRALLRSKLAESPRAGRAVEQLDEADKASGIEAQMRRLPLALYWALYLPLVVWVIVSGLHLVRTSIWLPILLMAVLDWFMTRESQLRYVFAAFLMLAILSMMTMQLFLAPAASLWVRSVYQVAALLTALSAYQILLWRVVLRGPRSAGGRCRTTG